MDASFVTVHRSFDAIHADLIGDLLRQNGIAARVIGTRNAAGIGVGQSISELHIEVPAEQAGAATDFLEAYFGGEMAKEAAAEGEEADEDPAPARTRPLSPLLAGGGLLLPFGGCHLYARRYWTAGVIAIGMVIAIINAAQTNWHTAASGFCMVIALLLLDLVGGQLGVRAYNRGVRRSAVSQVAAGAVIVAVAGGVGVAIGSHLPVPALHHARPYAGALN